MCHLGVAFVRLLYLVFIYLRNKLTLCRNGGGKDMEELRRREEYNQNIFKAKNYFK